MSIILVCSAYAMMYADLPFEYRMLAGSPVIFVVLYALFVSLMNNKDDDSKL